MNRSAKIAALTAFSASFTLAGYEFVRSASNTLFKFAYGPQNIVWVLALTPIGVVGLLVLYNGLLTHFGPRRALLFTSLGSTGVLGLAYLGVEAKFQPATVLLYVFREAYVVLLIEQYWSFLNSKLTEGEAKRFNGPITGMASLGAILGGFLVHRLAQPLGTPAMLLFGAISLLPAALISDFAYRCFGEPKPKNKTKVKWTELGLERFSANPLLVYLLGLILVTQVVSAVLGIQFQTILQESIPVRDAQTAFSGKFYGWLNAAAACLQFIAAPLLMRWFSLAWVHLLIPLIHLGSCVYLVCFPSLLSAGLAFFLFKAFDYSIFRAAKEVFYIPLDFDSRFRAKEIIDVLGYRFGKAGVSVVIIVLQRAGIVFTNLYSWIALGALLLWLGTVKRLGTLHRTKE